MQDQDYMFLALQLAEKGRLTVSPNPMVGCVIVKNETIIGQGWHQVAGQAHAEIDALARAGEAARGARLYVTLEPCCYFGRTPPCTEALIRSGVTRVVIACEDPNPLVAGRGIQALRNAGIEVVLGICEQEAKELNKIFFHYMRSGRPYVISKWAMSWDGQTVTHPCDERQISGQVAFQHAHQTRQMVDAILIGSGTALSDNPQLTARNPGNTRHPLRVILASQGELPLHLRCFDPELPSKTITVATEMVDPAWLAQAQQKNIEVWICRSKEGRVDLQDVLDRLGKLGVSSVLLEGGQTLRTSFFRENFVNEVQVYLAPKIISDLYHKMSLQNFHFESLGQDLYLQGEISCLAVL